MGAARKNAEPAQPPVGGPEPAVQGLPQRRETDGLGPVNDQDHRPKAPTLKFLGAK